MRWELFDKAVNAARMVSQDDDIARDAAINALEECGEAPEGHILRRARDRAKDIIRSQRRAPTVMHFNMDELPNDSNVEAIVAEKQRREQLVGAIGTGHGTMLSLVHAGYTNAEIGAKLGVSEEQARKLRKSAEQAAENFTVKGH